jgi:acyl-coenzyme A thioesterase PaaI-like protein
MRTINQEHIIKLIELINKGPFFKLLSMQVRELSLGYCKLEVDLDTKHLNPFGGLHGGVYASL